MYPKIPYTPTRKINRSRGDHMTSTATETPTATVADIRKWAQENGFEVGARGRLSKDVLDAYAAAQAKKASRRRR